MPKDESHSSGLSVDPSSTDKKRRTSRRSSITSPANQSGNGTTTKQQTIQQHFVTSTHKPLVQPFQSPPSKRLKPNPPQTATPSTHQATPLGASTMYNFSSKTSRIPTVDLTSPSSTPPKRTEVLSVRPAFNPHTGAKKLVVKNLRTKERADPKKYFEQTWEQLLIALEAIFKSGEEVKSINGSLGSSLEELYRGVENLCRQGFSEELCRRLEAKCNNHVEKRLKDSLESFLGRPNVEVLAKVLETWDLWKSQLVSLCRNEFSYLRTTNINALMLPSESNSFHLLLSRSIIPASAILFTTIFGGDFLSVPHLR